MRAIDVRDLLERPGASKTVRVEEGVPGLHTELADVREDEPIEGALTLESVLDGIFVHGSISGRFTMRCARCLKEFERHFDLTVQEVFAREPGPEDDYAIGRDLSVDPEPMVRDAVVLEMPFSPLCKPDCLGLCPVCGGDRNLGECPGHEVTDPRWSELAGLFDEAPGDPRKNAANDASRRDAES
jgi:uncharacterized protein